MSSQNIESINFQVTDIEKHSDHSQWFSLSSLVLKNELFDRLDVFFSMLQIKTKQYSHV